VLVDHRTYYVKPGKMKTQLDLYEKLGFPIQLKHIGQPLCYLQAESGELNSLVHLWVYESAADRERRRAAMMQDPAWQEYLKESAVAACLDSQRTSLMVPVKFAPLVR
jgi:NIPSNAP